VRIFCETKKGNIVKYTTSCRGIIRDGASKFKKVIQYTVDYILGCMVYKG